MLQLADIVRQHGAEYLAKYGASVLRSHVRALGALARCRTPEMGGHLAHCDACGREHVLYHSCRHRACPKCGFDATTRWLAKQRELLLPVPYFHVVFTVPSELRRLIRANQKVLLSVLFRAAFESLRKLCADPHFLGTKQIGALAVLHTWSRTLEYHPHIHMLVPGGGLAADGNTWLRVPRRCKLFSFPRGRSPPASAGDSSSWLVVRTLDCTCPQLRGRKVGSFSQSQSCTAPSACSNTWDATCTGPRCRINRCLASMKTTWLSATATAATANARP